MKFNELNLRKEIVDATLKAKYEEASPIQEKAIPAILEGKDVLACAQTGTGKTAAFALPILHRLAENQTKDHVIRALVLTPTRELAAQIFENFKKFGRYLKLRDCCVYGGAPMKPQRMALYKGCDILIATPGRLNDFMDQGVIDLSQVEMLVLDEADRMLDMGFINDVKKIVKDIPEGRQTVMLSATMPKEIEKFADELLNDPEDIRMAPQASPAETVDQHLVFCEKGDKKRVLADMLNKEEVSKTIVFTRTKVGADRLVKRLEEDGIKAYAIHGDKTQGQRMNALQRFRTNQVQVLVATDVAARGIDIPDVTHVVNYDLPEEAESYIHRIGRVGRAGKEGTAVSLCCDEEMFVLAAIEKMLKKEIPELETEYTIKLERKKPSNGRNNFRRGGRRGSRGSDSRRGSRSEGRNSFSNRKPSGKRNAEGKEKKVHDAKPFAKKAGDRKPFEKFMSEQPEKKAKKSERISFDADSFNAESSERSFSERKSDRRSSSRRSEGRSFDKKNDRRSSGRRGASRNEEQSPKFIDRKSERKASAYGRKSDRRSSFGERKGGSRSSSRQGKFNKKDGRR